MSKSVRSWHFKPVVAEMAGPFRTQPNDNNNKCTGNINYQYNHDYHFRSFETIIVKDLCVEQFSCVMISWFIIVISHLLSGCRSGFHGLSSYFHRASLTCCTAAFYIWWQCLWYTCAQLLSAVLCSLLLKICLSPQLLNVRKQNRNHYKLKTSNSLEWNKEQKELQYNIWNSVEMWTIGELHDITNWCRSFCYCMQCNNTLLVHTWLTYSILPPPLLAHSRLVWDSTQKNPDWWCNSTEILVHVVSQTLYELDKFASQW